MYIDYDYYINAFCGEPMPEEEFKRLEARAADLIDNITLNRIQRLEFDEIQPFALGQIKKAVAAQTEYLYINGGAEFIADSGSIASMQIGKFSIGSKNRNAQDSATGGNIYAPSVKGYLLSTGLLYAGVGLCT